MKVGEIESIGAYVSTRRSAAAKIHAIVVDALRCAHVSPHAVRGYSDVVASQEWVGYSARGHTVYIICLLVTVSLICYCVCRLVLGVVPHLNHMP